LILARILNKKENENNKLNKNEHIEKWEFLLKILKFNFKSSSILILKVKCVLPFAAFFNQIFVQNIFSQMSYFQNILPVLLLCIILFFGSLTLKAHMGYQKTPVLFLID